MNKNEAIVYMGLLIMLYITVKPAEATNLESAFGRLSDSCNKQELPEKENNLNNKISYKSQDILERASYKVTFKLTDQKVCGLAGCIAAAVGNSADIVINFRGKKNGAFYPATVNNLTQGVSNFDGVAVNKKSNGIGFGVPYVFEDSNFIYDLTAVCGGRFISGKRRIEGTCTTTYNTQGFAVTHRGSFSGFKQ